MTSPLSIVDIWSWYPTRHINICIRESDTKSTLVNISSALEGALIMVLTHAVAVNIAKPCQIGEQRTRNHHKASQSSIQVLLSLKKDCDVIIAISTIILYIYIYIYVYYVRTSLYMIHINTIDKQYKAYDDIHVHEFIYSTEVFHCVNRRRFKLTCQSCISRCYITKEEKDITVHFSIYAWWTN